MPEVAASFLTNVYSSAGPPSWFELLAAEGLVESLRNAVHFTSVVTAQLNPTWAPLISEWWESGFYSSLLLLETFHLVRYHAGFAEHFYGLQRTPFEPRWTSLCITREGRVVGSQGKEEEARHDLVTALSPQKPTRQRILLSLLFLVAVPFVKTKLAQGYQERLASLAPDLTPDPQTPDPDSGITCEFHSVEDSLEEVPESCSVSCRDGSPIANNVQTGVTPDLKELKELKENETMDGKEEIGGVTSEMMRFINSVGASGATLSSNESSGSGNSGNRHYLLNCLIGGLSRLCSSDLVESGGRIWNNLLETSREMLRWMRRLGSKLRRILSSRWNSVKSGIHSNFQLLSKANNSIQFIQILKLILTDSFWAVFPLAYTLHEVVFAAFKMMYLLDNEKWPFWTPYLRVQKLVLRSRSPDPPAIPSTPTHNTWFGTVTKAADTTFKFSLLAGIYGIRLYEWWVQNESRLRPNRLTSTSNAIDSSVPSVPPPPVLLYSIKNAKQQIALPQDPHICPLCREIRRQPVASVSGYTFCHPCLSQFVKSNGRCPLTGLPMGVEQMRRIFESV